MALSIASVYNLPIIPIECRASARIPPSGPIPTASTKIAAIIKVGTALAKVIIARQTAKVAALGVVLRAAPNANGILNITDAVVPINAIHKVSIVASIT